MNRLRLTAKPIAPWIGSRCDDYSCDVANEKGERLPWSWNGKTPEEAIGRAVCFLVARNEAINIYQVTVLTGDRERGNHTFTARPDQRAEAAEPEATAASFDQWWKTLSIP